MRSHPLPRTTGTERSHLATTLGVDAVKAANSVYFTTLAELISTLARAERKGVCRTRAASSAAGRFWQSMRIVPGRASPRAGHEPVDQLGARHHHQRVLQGGGNLFFQPAGERYERGAMVLTSNRAFAEWGGTFGDTVVATALLDRLLHHAVVVQIDGSSYRLLHAELMFDHLRSKATLAPPSVAPLPAGGDARRERLSLRHQIHIL